MGQNHNNKLMSAIVDGLFVLLSMVLIFTGSAVPQHGNCHAFVMFEPFIMIYCLLRVLFSVNYKLTSGLLLIAIAVFCTYELYCGYYQLFQNFGRNRAQDIIVGSFSNSGPFGCFLSTCSSLFIAVRFRETSGFIRISSLILTALSLILMICTLSRASMIAFMSSMLFLAMKSETIILFVRRYRIHLLLIALLFGTGVYLIKKPSADGRILMDRIGLSIIKKNGFKGVGLGNYAGAYGRAQADFFAEYMDSFPDDIDKIPLKQRMIADCPAFAFNEYIRIGVESGPVSSLLLVCLMICGVVSAYKCNSQWCYPLISISVFAFFSYPYEVGALTILMIICLASVGSRSKKCGWGIAFYCILFSLITCSCCLRYPSLNKTLSGNGANAVERLCGNRHRKFMVHDYNSLQDGLYDEKMLFLMGQSLYRSGNYTKSDSVLKLATEVSSDPMFWNVMGNNSLAQGRFREAESRYIRAFYMVPNRLYPLYLLAKLYHEEGDTVRFLEMAHIVETFIPKVESANTERLRDEIRELGNVSYGQTSR